MSYYRYHVFFCTNLREDGSAAVSALMRWACAIMPNSAARTWASPVGESASIPQDVLTAVKKDR
jgi:hypothetical protein